MESSAASWCPRGSHVNSQRASGGCVLAMISFTIFAISVSTMMPKFPTVMNKYYSNLVD